MREKCFLNYVVGYVNYKKDFCKSLFGKLFNKFFFRVKVNKLENGYFEFRINKNVMNNRRVLKIRKWASRFNVNKLVICQGLIYKNKEITFEKNCEKILMKNIVKQILRHVYDCQNKDMRLENLYVAVKDDKNKDIIIDLASEFKSINIVTDTIKKLRRLGLKLERQEEINFSISNNHKKSLRRASVIVNFDYDSDFFSEFNISRDAIIINLNENRLELSKGFDGIVIENVRINYENSDVEILNLKNFFKTDLYESYICNFNYWKIQENYILNNCIITDLIGKNGCIEKFELNLQNDSYSFY